MILGGSLFLGVECRYDIYICIYNLTYICTSVETLIFPLAGGGLDSCPLLASRSRDFVEVEDLAMITTKENWKAWFRGVFR